jgi:lipid-A-disaccharide synthase
LTLHIMLVAGEPSGDALGAPLMAALRALRGDVRFSGVGGARMVGEGLESRFPMAELSVMGLTEVVPRIPLVLRRLRELESFARSTQPDAIVTIDSPGFNFRLCRRLKRAGLPLIHYVAPTVWAWRPGRARKVARFLDHLLALFPFEPPYFEREGLGCSFVGHPVVESGAERADGKAFRARHGIPPEAPLVVVLPGSRRSETSRLLEPFAETLALLTPRFPDLQAVVPTVETVAEEVSRAAKGWPVPTRVLPDFADKFPAMAAADVALAASGTVALELAMTGTPMVIGYRVSAVSAAIARRMIKVPYANLVNLLVGEGVIPELIQERCTPERLAKAVAEILVDPATRAAQTAACRAAVAALGHGGPPPSRRAAETVLAIVGSRP